MGPCDGVLANSEVAILPVEMSGDVSVCVMVMDLCGGRCCEMLLDACNEGGVSCGRGYANFVLPWQLAWCGSSDVSASVANKTGEMARAVPRATQAREVRAISLCEELLFREVSCITLRNSL